MVTKQAPFQSLHPVCRRNALVHKALNAVESTAEKAIGSVVATPDASDHT
jgi:hypothetical protein